MSSNWHDPVQTHHHIATLEGETGASQGHERFNDNDDDLISGLSAPVAMALTSDHVEPTEVDITPGQKMLSAMSGSLLTSLLVTPLDVVRVRLQSQPSQASPLTAIREAAVSAPQSLRALPPNLGVTACCREVFFANNTTEFCMASPRLGDLGTTTAADCAVEETQRRSINSTFDGLRKIARNEGITTLWRGLSPTLVMTIPGNIIYFTGYDWLRYNNQSPIKRVFSDNYSPLVAGATARVAAAGIISPIEMFRTRMQASQSVGASHFAETAQGMKEMVRGHGYTSLWRGFSLTLWRDVPFSGLYWWGYETCRGLLTEARHKSRGRPLDVEGSGTRARARSRSQSEENHRATFIDSFISGATSGALASVVTTPFDVGKTRRQVFKECLPSSENAVKILSPEEQSMPRFLWHIFKTEGTAGLFKGWIPRTLKVAPACAIMISSYEVGKRAFKGVNERAELKRKAV